MVDTFSFLRYHLVFSTKNRFPFLEPEQQEHCWAYIGAVVRENGGTPIAVGGMRDHVHILLGLPHTMALSAMVRKIKSCSSAGLKKLFPDLKGLSWQDGYGIFTVSQSQVETVRNYILNQKKHHKTQDYSGELSAILKKHQLT